MTYTVGCQGVVQLGGLLQGVVKSTIGTLDIGTLLGSFSWSFLVRKRTLGGMLGSFSSLCRTLNVPYNIP